MIDEGEHDADRRRDETEAHQDRSPVIRVSRIQTDLQDESPHQQHRQAPPKGRGFQPRGDASTGTDVFDDNVIEGTARTEPAAHEAPLERAADEPRDHDREDDKTQQRIDEPADDRDRNEDPDDRLNHFPRSHQITPIPRAIEKATSMTPTIA